MYVRKGNYNKAIKLFEKNLEYFREFYDVKTIVCHGSPLTKWNNKDIWDEYDYKDYIEVPLYLNGYVNTLNGLEGLQFQFTYNNTYYALDENNEINLNDVLEGFFFDISNLSLDDTLITLFLIGNDTTWPIKLWAKMRVGFSKQVNASVTLILILTSFLVLLNASIVSRSEKRIMY